jgi:hypothetical protein
VRDELVGSVLHLWQVAWEVPLMLLALPSDGPASELVSAWLRDLDTWPDS